MNICLFDADEVAKPLPLTDERARHIVRVLHKGVGDTFRAGVIGGESGLAAITGVQDGALLFDFAPDGDGKPLYPLVMVIGFPRPIQLKRLLRDMASLGVMAVHLTATELGEKSYLSSTLATTDAARAMLRDGSVQAASTHVPLLAMHRSLGDCLRAVNAEYASPRAKLALDNVSPACPVAGLGADMLRPPVVAAIGSERGWSDTERQLLEADGYVRVGMGSRILRTETAATAAASILLCRMGHMG